MGGGGWETVNKGAIKGTRWGDIKLHSGRAGERYCNIYDKYQSIPTIANIFCPGLSEV